MSESPLFDNLVNAKNEPIYNNLKGQHIMAYATPNVGLIKNPKARKWVGGILNGLAIFAAVVMLFLLFFPEVEIGDEVLNRAVQFVNALVLLLSGSFGIVVTLPNVPSTK